MTYIPPHNAKPILLAYFLGALACAAAGPLLRGICASLGYAPALVNLGLVVLAIPLLIFALAIAYPSLKITLVGVSLLTISLASSFAVGRSIFSTPANSASIRPASPPLGRQPLPFLIEDMAIAVLLAWPMYSGVGLMGVWLAHPWRRVGIRNDHRCGHCQYSLIGLTQARCPECGREFDAARLEGLITGDADLGERSQSSR